MKLGMNVSMVRNTADVEMGVFSRKIASILVDVYESASGAKPTVDELVHGYAGPSHHIATEAVALYTNKPIPKEMGGSKLIAAFDDAAVFLFIAIGAKFKFKLKDKKLTPLMAATVAKLAYKCAVLRGNIERPNVGLHIKRILSKGNLPEDPTTPMSNALKLVRWTERVAPTTEDGYSYIRHEGAPCALLHIEYVTYGTSYGTRVGVICSPAFRDYLNSDVFTDSDRKALAKQFHAMVNQAQHTFLYKAT